MKTETKHTITVLLTRHHNLFSNFIYIITGRGYTHASIALSEDCEYYYSFTFKGFRREYPSKRWKCGKSICYKLEVSEKDFEKLQIKIAEMEDKKELFHYSRLGVAFCLMHIPVKRQHHYFCSQFVAEMLQSMDCISLNKKASLYFPNHLSEELGKQRCLKHIIHNPI